MPKFWVSLRKSPELASKYAWVRPENRSELGAQNRKNNTENRAGEIPNFFENSLLKPLNGQPILGQCKENWFESQ